MRVYLERLAVMVFRQPDFARPQIASAEAIPIIDVMNLPTLPGMIGRIVYLLVHTYQAL